MTYWLHAHTDRRRKKLSRKSTSIWNFLAYLWVPTTRKNVWKRNTHNFPLRFLLWKLDILAPFAKTKKMLPNHRFSVLYVRFTTCIHKSRKDFHFSTKNEKTETYTFHSNITNSKECKPNVVRGTNHMWVVEGVSFPKIIYTYVNVRRNKIEWIALPFEWTP